MADRTTEAWMDAARARLRAWGADHAMDPLWHALTPTERVFVDAEAPITPREKLRRVREAREVLATARVAFVQQGSGVEAAAESVVNAATGLKIAVVRWLPRWSDLRGWVELRDRTVYQSEGHGDWRTWVLDTLRAEGWDVVEEGEGDG